MKLADLRKAIEYVKPEDFTLVPGKSTPVWSEAYLDMIDKHIDALLDVAEAAKELSYEHDFDSVDGCSHCTCIAHKEFYKAIAKLEAVE